MWSRVFGRSDTPPDPAALLAHLHGQGFQVTGHFRGDDLGWTGAELTLPPGDAAVTVERYLAKDDDLRDDLNAWAAWLETQEHQPHHRALMERVIGTKQLITLRRPPAEGETLDRLCRAACQWLAGQTDGVYQTDGEGFSAADGTLLVRENGTTDARG